MKSNIKTLMIAVGDTSDVDDSKSISEMLSTFSVGTERRKSVRNNVLDTSLIGPIRNLPYKTLVSTEQLTKTRLGRVKKKSESVNKDKTTEDNLPVLDNRSWCEKIVLEKEDGKQTYGYAPCVFLRQRKYNASLLS